MRTEIVKISELVLDEEIYPRFRTDWLTAYQYAMAMKAGAEFPKIIVGKFRGKLYLLDGWHRVKALQLLGEEYAQAVIKSYNSKKDMFVEAVKLNSKHGRPLSSQEKARIIKKLEDYGFSLEQISRIVHIPVDKIERFKVKIVYGPNGKPIYLKGIVEKAIKQTEAKPEEIATLDQKSFNVRNVKQLLNQLIELLETGVYPWKNEEIKELTIRLYNLLSSTLQLKVA